MLMLLFSANTDLPLLGFCKEFLLGSKYDGIANEVGLQESPDFANFTHLSPPTQSLSLNAKPTKHHHLENPHEIHQLQNLPRILKTEKIAATA
jgi:hypothetical protein